MKDLWVEIIEQNKMRIAMVIGVASLITGTLFLFSGCNFGDFIKSDIPLRAQQSQGLPSQMSHNDSAETFQDVQADIAAMLTAWRARLEESGMRVGIAEGILMQGVESGLPLLDYVLPGLSLLIGTLLIKRPGDVRASVVGAEKIDSYNKGVEDGKAIVTALIAAGKTANLKTD